MCSSVFLKIITIPFALESGETIGNDTPIVLGPNCIDVVSFTFYHSFIESETLYSKLYTMLYICVQSRLIRNDDTKRKQYVSGLIFTNFSTAITYYHMLKAVKNQEGIIFTNRMLKKRSTDRWRNQT